MTVDEAECDPEKENNPESMTISSNTSNPISALTVASHSLNKSSTNKSTGKDFLNDSTSSSVPIAHLLPTKANNGSPVKASLSNEEVTGPVVATVNFVFSPVASHRPAFYSGSSSASKAIKTPDSSIQTRQSSRTPLGNSSKRKLDLNFQIDQLPDKDFVEINNTKPIEINQASAAPAKQPSGRKSTGSLFKQPLTEHQKETRRHKSFIPIIMSHCTELDATMDSQMSMMDDDTNTQSMMGMPQQSQFNQISNQTSNSQSNEKNLLNSESSKAILQFKKVIN
jgi:hypothetical protein